MHLGDRIQHVEILSEKTVCGLSLNVGWTNRFGEINDILRVHQFAWLAKGKDSRWIKMQG